MAHEMFTCAIDGVPITMAQRQFWTCEVSVGDLLLAVEVRQKYHLKKVEEWTEKLLAAETDFRQHGVDLRSVIASGSQSTRTGSYNQPTINYEMTQVIAGARSRLKYHEGELEALRSYQILFDRTFLNTLFRLTVDDLRYFFPSETDLAGQEQDDQD